MPYKSEPTHRERAGADLLLSLTKKSIVTPATTNSTTNTMYSKALHSPIKTSSFSNDWSPSSVSNILQNPLETSPDRHRHHDSTGEEDEHLPPPQPPMEAHKEYNDAAALGVDHKQRIISPSSSNERPDDDESIKTTQIQHHQQPYPSWTGPPPPHYPFAYPQPPPYGAPPFGGWPCLYPPPHGMPPPPPQLYPDAVAEDGLATNVNRCVPLKPPIPTRYWGTTHTLVHPKLPDFARLVNFPDYLARGRHCDKHTDQKHCVMCGKLRSIKTTTKKANADSHIIPKQNKGVCTCCDVAIWMMVDTNLEIKWCKGCKNFKYWCDFGDKGLATKCLKCRNRQKEKYMAQKQQK